MPAFCSPLSALRRTIITDINASKMFARWSASVADTEAADDEWMANNREGHYVAFAFVLYRRAKDLSPGHLKSP